MLLDAYNHTPIVFILLIIQSTHQYNITGLFIATCFDSTESSLGYDWNHMCSQGTRTHFGIPKRLTRFFFPEKGYLIVYNCNFAKYN